MISEIAFKKRVNKYLRTQGYGVKNGVISLEVNDKDSYRKVQKHSRFLKVKQHFDFLEKNKQLALDHIVDGKKIDIKKIKPKLIEVKSGTKWEILFKWWCFVWWSIPYERPIGRQMRFVVWDEHHKSIIGLIGLQSPILSWAPRDEYLSLNKGQREIWVNQSLNAQRVGALPPYNKILGSRLVASMLISKKIRTSFQKKYRDKKTEMKNRKLPNRLLFITTTGAFGKSPIYERLSYQQQKLSFFLGYTKGFGSFHISDDIYQSMLEYLSSHKIDIKRGYGSGPSRKMRLINETMSRLGFLKGANHKVKRGVYLFTPVKNLHEVIQENKRPKYSNFSVEELTDFWKERWILPRMGNKKTYRNFVAREYIMKELKEIEQYG